MGKDRLNFEDFNIITNNPMCQGCPARELHLESAKFEDFEGDVQYIHEIKCTHRRACEYIYDKMKGENK